LTKKWPSSSLWERGLITRRCYSKKPESPRLTIGPFCSRGEVLYPWNAVRKINAVQLDMEDRATTPLVDYSHKMHIALHDYDDDISYSDNLFCSFKFQTGILLLEDKEPVQATKQGSDT